MKAEGASLTNMSYLERARGYATQAVAFLDEHEIAPVPRNFALAYVYYDGSNVAVRETVNRLQGFGKLDPVSFSRIHDEVYGLDEEASSIRKASAAIQATLAQVLDAMGDAGKNAEDYGKVLAEFSGKVENSDGAGGLREAISNILTETRKMESRTLDLEKRFSDASDEITGLRQDLDEMRIAATTDALTGLSNRKHFDHTLLEAIAAHDKSGAPLALLVGDIDHFKAFNDNHGHQVGDMVLRLVSAAMQESVRGRDFVARYGGEEFVVILPETTVAGAMSVADNIRTTIASKRISRRSTGENLGKVTISFGAAQYVHGEPACDLIDRADRGLYEAKHRGRNRVSSVDPLANDFRETA